MWLKMPQMMPIAWLWMTLVTAALVWTTASALFFTPAAAVVASAPSKALHKLSWLW